MKESLGETATKSGLHIFRAELGTGIRICVQCGRPKTQRVKMIACDRVAASTGRQSLDNR
ncbi:hypothetical protein A6U87_17680 [Rhizobium sp. AC44/96]|jgi:hypothetical protein|nr:hypothetical protein A6U87_17680 [Rhizobium sp. AC44/96]